MTNKNSHWKANEEAYPMLLKPCGKDYLWGGQRLNNDFEKGLALDTFAESWECSTHPDGPSIVASGIFEGLTLKEVLKQKPQFVGTHPGNVEVLENGELPILIKFIDANQNLSIQVHPDDEYAKANENGSLGKTEMWYVLDADADAKLVYGLSRKTTAEKIRASVLNGTVGKYLQKVPVKKDDVFFIEAGMIHAIGKGILVAEIQENSNLTYRLYDYDRVDKNGHKRELHLDKALAVANLSEAPKPKQPMRVLKYERGCASEFLCRCKYFQVERLLLNTERCRDMVPFATDSVSFQVLLCIKGCGTIFYGDEHLPFMKGDCIFVPADSVQLKLHGKAQFLKVSC